MVLLIWWLGRRMSMGERSGTYYLPVSVVNRSIPVTLRRPRILLPVSKTGRVYLHKAKRNSNQTFSKGKTWNLEDLRAVRLEEVSSSAGIPLQDTNSSPGPYIRVDHDQ